MSKYIKTYNDFLGWLRTLNLKELPEQQKRIIKIMLTNFDNLFEKKSAGGTRNSFISSLIKESSNNNEPVIVDLDFVGIDGSNSSEIRELKSLEVESFRGFKSKETIDFDKKYTLIFGCNGSGKSSLCEALEYSLLNYITEAIERRIDVEKFIKNSLTGQYIIPKLIGIDSDGNDLVIKPDMNNYRACFVEKNRIEKFARISANSSSNQRNLIAALFGLDEFSDFVENFSEDISQHLIVRVKNEELEKKQDELKGCEQIIKQYDEKVKRIDEDKKDLINKFEFNGDFEALDLFLHGDDGDNIGEILKLNNEIGEIQQKKYSFKSTVELLNLANTILLATANCKSLLKEFNNKKDLVNFRKLYEAALKVKSLDVSQCPLCETPLEKATSNPFKRAETGLEELGQIVELEEQIGISKRTIINNIGIIISNLKEWKLLSEELELNLIFPDDLDFNIEDNRSQFDIVIAWIELIINVFIENWKEFLKAEIQLIILNIKASKAIQLKEELARKKSKLERISESLKKIKQEAAVFYKQKKDAVEFINNFNKTNEKLIEAAKKEKNANKELFEYSDAYVALITSLKEYKNALPVKLVENLNQLTLKIYNIINEHDKEFEKFEKLQLPSGPIGNIKVWFKNSPAKEEDALHILSEGHIKCLGLAILIAKNIQDKMPFVIFDDVVNAIDDDHRGGIRQLLFQSDYLKDKQIILTSHAEEFINDSCHDFTAKGLNKLVRQITFYTGDERGINIEKDNHHYLSKAKSFNIRGKHRDTLSNCRKALENISDRFWKKLHKDGYNAEISVRVFSPKGSISLMSKITGLRKRIDEIEAEHPYSKEKQILEFLCGLENNSPTIWNYLNKGTHDLLDQIEFDGTIVKSILDAILLLEELVNSKKKDQLSFKKDDNNRINVEHKSISSKQNEQVDSGTSVEVSVLHNFKL